MLLIVDVLEVDVLVVDVLELDVLEARPFFSMFRTKTEDHINGKIM